jgi:HEAT repeat protein
VLVSKPLKSLQVVEETGKRHDGLDLRLAQPALDTVTRRFGSHYRGISAQEVPGWVKPLAPLLEEALNLRGEETAAQRLDLLVRVAPETGLRYCRAALRGASDVVLQKVFDHLRLLPDLPDLVPDLIALFPQINPYTRGQAAGLVAQVGLPAIPALVPLLGDANDARWSGAATALSLMADPKHSPIAAEACELLRPEVPRLLDSLAAAGDDALSCTLALLARLQPGDPVVSRRVIELLRAEADADARQGLPRQGPPQSWKDTPAGRRRVSMLYHLAGHGVADEGDLEVIAERARHDPDSHVHQRAVHCLSDLAGAHPRALHWLVSLLDQRSHYCEAVYVLGSKREKALPVLPEVIAQVRGPDRASQLSALEVLGCMGPCAREALPALRQAARHNNKEVREKALRAVGEVGKAAPTEAVAILTAALQDAEKEVRGAALGGLANLGGKVPGVVDGLRASLKDPDEWVRQQVLYLLRQLRPLNPALLPLFLESMQDPCIYVRCQALGALRLFGTRVPGTLDALAGVLRQDPDRWVRRHAAEELGRLRPFTAGNVAALRQALADAEEDVRHQAVISLGWIGALAAPALPELRKMAGKYPRDKAIPKAIQRIEAPPKKPAARKKK